MAENLSVTRYRNGNPKPTGNTNTEWLNLHADIHAFYAHESISGLDSEEEVLNAKGALYIWYAVTDSRY